ncbi:MAG TPA: class I SAM-dependent methyltransferase [Egicoccus sp.]|nr:class I SAM-dependent methyltransferase [Egicoccus sp.]HSK24868.1 class I SAM-dependent methyltransferase [Egicoccus sp.]
MSDERTRWNARHAGRAPLTEPAHFLVRHASLLPPRGRALDVAGGSGRNAVWLAQRGLQVTLVDVADEACRLAADAASNAGVEIVVERRDVSAAGLPPGPWNVIVFHHFLDRDLWAPAAAALAPGGVLLISQPTVHNLERHDRPSREWLLEPGELDAAARTWPDVEVVVADEGWTDDDRHESSVVARRPVTS